MCRPQAVYLVCGTRTYGGGGAPSDGIGLRDKAAIRMIRIRDTLGGDPISFHYCEWALDLREVARFIKQHSALGLDTESTGINCYRVGWGLRTFQVGNANRSYVVPARFFNFIGWAMRQEVNWIAHNGPHDIRSIDRFLGYDTGVDCAGETYLPAHHYDSRKPDEGGIRHALKEQAIAHVARDAGKWEVELKKAFKQIEVPVPGEVYKSGTRKGQPRMRKARLDEGWSLIDPTHPAYIAYAAADPILAYRLWAYYQGVVRQFHALYRADKRLQEAADKLQRRAIKLDVEYTRRLDRAYVRKAEEFTRRASEFGCENINSGQQLAEVLMELGARLTARTPSGQFKTDDKVLRRLASSGNAEVQEFIHCVLGAKQMMKRRENYTQAMLRETDSEGRVHPSINILGARTARMSVSSPALQQLPTANREEDAQ
jgi:DNA polymerase-1